MLLAPRPFSLLLLILCILLILTHTTASHSRSLLHPPSPPLPPSHLTLALLPDLLLLTPSSFILHASYFVLFPSHPPHSFLALLVPPPFFSASLSYSFFIRPFSCPPRPHLPRSFPSFLPTPISVSLSSSPSCLSGPGSSAAVRTAVYAALADVVASSEVCTAGASAVGAGTRALGGEDLAAGASPPPTTSLLTASLYTASTIWGDTTAGKAEEREGAGKGKGTAEHSVGRRGRDAARERKRASHPHPHPASVHGAHGHGGHGHGVPAHNRSPEWGRVERAGSIGGGRGEAVFTGGGGPFPPTNAANQRICQQCGLPRCYKEGKCIEKWGPGPLGPGTVYAAKRWKRVERRGTLEQQAASAAVMPATTSTSFRTASMHRIDTLLSTPYCEPVQESSMRSSLASPSQPATSASTVPTSTSTSNPVPTPAQNAGRIIKNRLMRMPGLGAASGASGLPPPLRTHSLMEEDLDAEAEAEVDEIDGDDDAEAEAEAEVDGLIM
ncbi:hypothetical protein DFH09DRAFT_1331624 [Mycena vulgaris]|nr:hypothetical protein DFH09DRAFT_1331624 [Mycena vulgaris]